MSPNATSNEVLSSILSKIDAFTKWNELPFNSHQILKLKCFLALKVRLRDVDATVLSPPYEVDELWHQMILHTKIYREFQAHMNMTIDHDPGGKNADAASRKKRQERYDVTKSLWIAMYGDGSWNQVKEDKDDEEDDGAEDLEENLYFKRARVGEQKRVLPVSSLDSKAAVKSANESETFTITVRILGRGDMMARVCASCSIEKLRNLVAKQFNLSPTDFRLNFDGMAIYDGKLSDYGVENGDTIQGMIAQLGC